MNPVDEHLLVALVNPDCIKVVGDAYRNVGRAITPEGATIPKDSMAMTSRTSGRNVCIASSFSGG